MARKKKTEEAIPIYVVGTIGDNLIRIAWKFNLGFKELREMNPDIKGPGFYIRPGQRVRIK